MQEIKCKCYGVMVASDLAGIGYNVMARFKNEDDAKTIAKGKGHMGSDGTIKCEEWNIVIYDSIGEYNLQKELNKYKEITKDLTPEQRRNLLNFLVNENKTNEG